MGLAVYGRICKCALNFAQQRRGSGAPLAVIYTHAARKPNQITAVALGQKRSDALQQSLSLKGTVNDVWRATTL